MGKDKITLYMSKRIEIIKSLKETIKVSNSPLVTDKHSPEVPLPPDHGYKSILTLKYAEEARLIGLCDPSTCNASGFYDNIKGSIIIIFDPMDEDPTGHLYRKGIDEGEPTNLIVFVSGINPVHSYSTTFEELDNKTGSERWDQLF